MIQKYRKKPVVIEAVKWTGDNWSEIHNWMNEVHQNGNRKLNDIFIYTLEGVMVADLGDYIIKGIKNEFYPCKSDVFCLSYEEDTYDCLGS